MGGKLPLQIYIVGAHSSLLLLFFEKVCLKVLALTADGLKDSVATTLGEKFITCEEVIRRILGRGRVQERLSPFTTSLV